MDYSSLKFYEANILACFSNKEPEKIPRNISLFMEGKYEELLTSDVALAILTRNGDSSASPNDLGNFLTSNVETWISQPNEDQWFRELDVLLVAASSLQLFIQNNYLGPLTSSSPLHYCHPHFQHKETNVINEALGELSHDGETVYSQSRFVLYLYIAHILLLDCRTFSTHCQSWDWWLLRSLLIQQALLSEKSPTMKTTVLELIENLQQKESLMTDDANKELQILFHVEAGYACHTYYEYKRAAEHFESARKVAGIKVYLSGAMGKRTRFQVENKAQLVLHIERDEVTKNDDFWRQEQPEAAIPKILPLDDDTVLDEINFADDSVKCSSHLSQIEQVLVLGLMESYRRSQAQERLTTEEVLTYISHILNTVSNWSVAVAALVLRSKLEQDTRRRIERSMNQFEVLAKCVTTVSNDPPISRRASCFYGCHVAPVWTVQRDLAMLLLSLGCYGEALDVFEKLELWEDVIACYQRLGKREKAESVIRERLAIKETPSLLCYLGDVTRCIDHYQKAWELSNHRNARAIRCMGYVYFQEEKYEKAIEAFAKSLEINSLQIPVWFTYGCAAMACQKFDVAAKAFRRAVSIDYDNFEAWANLATCYVKLQQKQKAFSTLQDALRCNHDNWRLWENCLIIGTDVGEFDDVIRSYHRLLDLKDKWADSQILGILTRAVVEDIPDANGRPASRLSQKLSELFGRVTSKITSDGEIWLQYAKLCSHKIGDKEPDMEKTMQMLQKAHRCFTSQKDWEKDLELCKKVAEQAIELVQMHVNLSEGKPPPEAMRLLSSAKLMFRGTLVKIQKQHTDPITQELLSDLAELNQRMETVLKDIVAKTDAARAVV